MYGTFAYARDFVRKLVAVEAFPKRLERCLYFSRDNEIMTIG